jgi:hypothetical protein
LIFKCSCREIAIAVFHSIGRYADAAIPHA